MVVLSAPATARSVSQIQHALDSTMGEQVLHASLRLGATMQSARKALAHATVLCAESAADLLSYLDHIGRPFQEPRAGPPAGSSEIAEVGLVEKLVGGTTAQDLHVQKQAAAALGELSVFAETPSEELLAVVQCLKRVKSIHAASLVYVTSITCM
jgi:hypothetical protein